MKNKSTIILLVSFFFFVFNDSSYAYNKIVHDIITTSSAEKSGINQFLITLGYGLGIKTEFINSQGYVKKVSDWIVVGGVREDDSPDECRPELTRASNHFHDPTKAWDLAFFDNDLNATYTQAYDRPPASALLWGLDYLDNIVPPRSIQDFEKNTTGDWSWPKARDLFYEALTSDQSLARESKFADSLRALGQVTHLIQDMSVPAHTRNDPHVFPLTSPARPCLPDFFSDLLDALLNIPPYPWHYETYTWNWAENEYDDFENFIYGIFPVFPSQNIFTLAGDTKLSQVSRLFDTNTVGNEGIVSLLADNIGLSEYTNANFFSKDTIFTYPYPSKEETTYKQTVRTARDGQVDTVLHYYRVTDPQQRPIAALGYWAENVAESELIVTYLDNEVFASYASLLIPRAIGYSAALLDYFFRGELEIVSLPIYTKNGYYRLVGMKIKNITENEESLTDGSFSLVLQHPNPDYNPDDPTSPRELYTQAYADYDLTVTKIKIDQLEFDQEKEVYFYLPPLDLSADDADSISFMLVYRGGLGNEDDAVIGKHFKPEAVEIFVEEWDSLEGNYPWEHTSEDSNPDNGTTSNSYADAIDGAGNLVTTLVKENIRFEGYDTPRINQTVLNLSAQNFEITPNTYIQFKIDEMSINEQPPAPPETTSAWQFLSFGFSDGSTLQISVDGQGVLFNNLTYFYNFWKEHIWRGNIYTLLQKNSSAPDSLFLEKISLVQELYDLESPSLIQHEQYMEIDSIRLFEAVPQ